MEYEEQICREISTIISWLDREDPNEQDDMTRFAHRLNHLADEYIKIIHEKCVPNVNNEAIATRENENGDERSENEAKRRTERTQRNTNDNVSRKSKASKVAVEVVESGLQDSFVASNKTTINENEDVNNVMTTIKSGNEYTDLGIFLEDCELFEV